MSEYSQVCGVKTVTVNLDPDEVEAFAEKWRESIREFPMITYTKPLKTDFSKGGTGGAVDYIKFCQMAKTSTDSRTYFQQLYCPRRSEETIEFEVMRG